RDQEEGHSLSLLLIEDSESDAVIIKKQLSTIPEISYVYHAESFQKTRQYLKEELIDVILTDLYLSDSDGLATLYELTKILDKEVPIIVLSGLSDEAVALDAVILGAKDYLLKEDIETLRGSIFHSLHHSYMLNSKKGFTEKSFFLQKSTGGLIFLLNNELYIEEVKGICKQCSSQIIENFDGIHFCDLLYESSIGNKDFFDQIEDIKKIPNKVLSFEGYIDCFSRSCQRHISINISRVDHNETTFLCTGLDITKPHRIHV
ncbi:MAG: response regulator, partial [Verrucomicrobiota bacterium]